MDAGTTSTILRQARRADLPGIWEVRYAVTENTLPGGIISDEDVLREVEETGRGWVVEVDGRIEGFAICNARTGNIWALFVHPRAQGRGYGDRLHAEMLDWLGTQQVPLLWLTTDPDTRAARFYAERGWQQVQALPSGEVRYERSNARGGKSPGN